MIDAPYVAQLSSPAGTSPIPFRGAGFLPADSPKPILSWIATLLVLCIWQSSSMLGWISPTFLPGPIAILSALGDLAVSGKLWADVSASLIRILVGWSLGTLAGLIIGISLALFAVARSIGVPLISALFPVPKIALLPLFIIWLGIGEGSKIFTLALAAFFPTAISTYTSIDSVPRNTIRMAQSFGVPIKSIIARVLIPGALPGIFSGMRISTALTLIVLVAAEMIGANEGIGAFVILSGSLMRSDQLLAGVVVLSILGLLIGSGISALDRTFLKWR
jgi:ABC-type nitrate/sulfonate/bicarbonate transport system permease component